MRERKLDRLPDLGGPRRTPVGVPGLAERGEVVVRQRLERVRSSACACLPSFAGLLPRFRACLGLGCGQIIPTFALADGCGRNPV